MSELFPDLGLSYGGHTAAAVEEPIQVHLRIRPFTSSERRDAKPVLTAVGDDSVLVSAPESVKTAERPGTYRFTRVHGPDTRQEDFYNTVLKPVVDSAVAHGRNGLLFAYGMTNAGKTFTVLGTEEEPGLLNRALADCVAFVNESNYAASSRRRIPDINSTESDITSEMLARAGSVQLPDLEEGERLELSLSCLEVYNEQVYDLLVSPQEGGVTRPILKIKDGISGRVFVQGLKHVDVRTLDDCLAVIHEACRNRKVAETAINGDSSRSHCVFGVHVWKTAAVVSPGEARFSVSSGLSSTLSTPIRSRAASSGVVAMPASRQLWCKLSVVDLAGSERQRRTASRGIRLKEAGCINNSLMSLMHCLETIRWNQKHANSHGGLARLVPFRETKLTRLFQDNLAGAGSGYTVMVLNVGPASCDFDETVHALKYGALAREIKIAPPVKAEAPTRQSHARFAKEKGVWEQERAELLSQIDDLQALNGALRADLRQAVERCHTIEIDVRAEVSEEMERIMREAEGRIRQMYLQASNDRVNKLEAMYKMRNAVFGKPSRKRAMPSVETIEEVDCRSDGDGDEEELVAECEDEITRLKVRHRLEQAELKEEVSTLRAQLKESKRVTRSSTRKPFGEVVM